jgi:hypothetical protein
MEEITIYFEDGNGASILGVVYGEELYMTLLPTLEAFAKERGGIITESVK